MTVDPMVRLAAVNPVVDLPTVESAERLRRLIEDGMGAIDLGGHHDGSSHDRRSRARMRVLAAIPVAVSATLAVLLLTAGSAGPGLNVAAAAYAATSPKSGIVEAVFMTRVDRGSQAGSTELRRDLYTVTEPSAGKGGTHISETSSAPGRWESWSAGRGGKLITRLKVPRDMKGNAAFGGIPLDGVEGIELYRELYRRGWMRLVGHERHQGRLLWKLESHPVYYDANGKRSTVQSHTKLIVLVDPKTFLPVSERQIDIVLPGHPTVVESNLVSYRHLTAGESVTKLFDLASQHPSARVITRTAASRFHSGKR